MTDKARHHGSTPDPDELRAQVEQTREELGRTIEALAAKADVKAQAQQKAAKVKGLVQGKAAHANEQLTETTHTLGRKIHDKTPQAGAREGRPEGEGRTEGAGTHATRNLLVLAGVGVAALAVIIAVRRGRRC
ncbi:DUF3618 domain-containing protein [Streptomyces sp. Wb2n-11]|uniref:DUF3618 domain-containing protein n=1 Tax=Streptomyces sp. Wb2n-11 TaxID=1030533 RepID=UPI000B19B92F|nr:DUF3618 domain-containing protein [Streptomyces sp. Wb2n-11]